MLSTKKLLLTCVATSSLFLAACGATPEGSSGAGLDQGNDWRAELIENAPVAKTADIPKDSTLWRAHERGKFVYGGTKTNTLFSIQNPVTGQLDGFDATMALLLAKYIVGKPSVDVTILTSATRQPLLDNGSIDAAFYTYSITPERQKKVDFAGPYYISGQSIQVKSDNTNIHKLSDLSGKKVCVDQGGTGLITMQNQVPTAELITLPSGTECAKMVEQGRADAQVSDRPNLLGENIASNNALKVVGSRLTSEPFGIGLPNESPEAVEFVNSWLKKMIKDGTWKTVYMNTIGKVEGSELVLPKPGEDLNIKTYADLEDDKS